MSTVIFKCILYSIALRSCFVLGVSKCESKVELRAVLLSCPAKDSGCDDDDPLSLAMTAEETIILQSTNKNFEALKEEKEKGFPNAVKDCKRKLIITLKVKNAGKIPCDDEYIVIDHVFDPVTGGKGRLLSPVVLKLRQEQMIQLYGLQFQRVVNSDPFEEEKDTEKVCSVDPDNPTCGITMYNGKPIPFSEGFCCSCDPKLNAKRQLSPISRSDSLLYQNSKLISQRNGRVSLKSFTSNTIINPNLVKLEKVSNSLKESKNEKREDKEKTNEYGCPIKGVPPEKIPNYLMEHDHKIICRKEDFLNELCRLQDEKSKESTDIFNYESSNSFDVAAVSDGNNLNFGLNINSINNDKLKSQKSFINEKINFATTSADLVLMTSSYEENSSNKNKTEVLKNLFNSLLTTKDDYSVMSYSDSVRGKRENQKEHNLLLREKKLTLQEKLNNFADSKNLITSRRKRLLQLSHDRYKKVPCKNAKECHAVVSVKVVHGDKVEKPMIPEYFFYHDRNIIDPEKPSIVVCNSTFPSDLEYASINNNDKIETLFTVPINVYQNSEKNYNKKINDEKCFEKKEERFNKLNNMGKVERQKESFNIVKNNLQGGKIRPDNIQMETQKDFSTGKKLEWNTENVKINGGLLEKKNKINYIENGRNEENKQKKMEIKINSDTYNSKTTNLNNLFFSTEIIKSLKSMEIPFLIKNNVENQEPSYFNSTNSISKMDDSLKLFTARYDKFLREKAFDKQSKEIVEQTGAKSLNSKKEEGEKKKNQKITDRNRFDLSKYMKNEKKEPNYLDTFMNLQENNEKNNYPTLKSKNIKISKKGKLKNCQEHNLIKNEEVGQKKYFKVSSKANLQSDQKHIFPLKQNMKEPQRNIDINLEKTSKQDTNSFYPQLYVPKKLYFKPKDFSADNINTKNLKGYSTVNGKLHLQNNLYSPEFSYQIPEQYFIFKSTKGEFPQSMKCYKNPEANVLKSKNWNYLKRFSKYGLDSSIENDKRYETLYNRESLGPYIINPKKTIKQFLRKNTLLHPKSKISNNGYLSNEAKRFFPNGLDDIFVSESKKVRIKRTTECSFEPAIGFLGSELQFVETEDFKKRGHNFKEGQIAHELQKCLPAKKGSRSNFAKSTENEENLKSKNRERLSRSYLNAPDYFIKNEKFIIKKKRNANDKNKKSKITSRSQGKCKKNLDLEGYTEDTAHCMRFGDLWYGVYVIKKPVVSQIVGIQLFDKHARCDGSTQWRDLTKGKMVRIGTFLPKAEDELPTISTTFLGGKTKKFESAIDPDNYLLLIPSHLSDPSKASYYPQVDGGPAEYLVVESKDISSGEDCNMIGTSFEAFARQPNRCSLPKGSCLKRQPMDLWREDMEARIRGKRGKYFVENFGTVSNSPIKTYTNFSGEFLALEYYGDYTSTIEIEVKADFNAIVRKGSNAQIPIVYIDGTYPKKTRIILSVLNIGLTSSYFRPRLGDCPPNLDPAWCPLEGPLVIIPPHQRHDFRLDLSGTLPPNKIIVTVQVLNQLNKKIAYRKIIIKKGDRCICAFHCKCNCIGRLKEGRICNKLPVEDYRGAGYVGPFPFREGAAPTSTESIRGNFKVILLTATCALLVLGAIKGILGILIRRMGIAGTRVIVGPRKILRYYESELECCSVLFDECGFPIHPTTCLPVQIVPLSVEILINFMFFFLYPLRTLWFFFLSLPCCTSFCEGCEVCCRQEGNYDYDKKSSHPLLPQNIHSTCVNYTTTTLSARKGKADEYLPYLPYKGDNDPLEEVDTEFVLAEMKRCRKN